MVNKHRARALPVPDVLLGRREVIVTEESKNFSLRHVGRSLSQTSHQINRALDSCIAMRVDPELTGVRCFMLGCIVRAKQSGQTLYQRDLERMFHVRRSSVTSMLKNMESAGFITRASVEQDARLKSLAPTEKGAACYERMVRCITAFEEQLLRGVDSEELARLYGTLEKLQTNAQQAPASLEASE